MLEMLGLKQNQFYFLFVVENVAFKIFVATDDTMKSKDLTFIVEEAIRKALNYKQ